MLPIEHESNLIRNADQRGLPGTDYTAILEAIAISFLKPRLL